MIEIISGSTEKILSSTEQTHIGISRLPMLMVGSPKMLRKLTG
jgi:hypothetical protein